MVFLPDMFTDHGLWAATEEACTQLCRALPMVLVCTVPLESGPERRRRLLTCHEHVFVQGRFEPMGPLPAV